MLNKVKAAWKAFDAVCSSKRGRFVISACYSVLAAAIWHKCGTDDAYEAICAADDIKITQPDGSVHEFTRTNK